MDISFYETEPNRTDYKNAQNRTEPNRTEPNRSYNHANYCKLVAGIVAATIGSGWSGVTRIYMAWNIDRPSHEKTRLKMISVVPKSCLQVVLQRQC